MTNRFSSAIDKKELLKFALGDGPYFVEDRNSQPEHWVSGSWNQDIMELHDLDAEQCAAGVRSMFSALVGNSPGAAATRVWPLIDHLQQYWSQRHGGWLQFDLGRVAGPVAAAIEAERQRCRRGDSEVPLSTIALAIRTIQRDGGLSELTG